KLIAGGAKVSGCGRQLSARQFGACKTGHVGIGVIFGIVVLAAVSPAAAYRPFDGTDAAVADGGEGELEFQSTAAIRPGQTKWGTVHLNAASNLTPDQHGELFFDAIVQGPNTWKVRPVFEIYSDSVITQSQTFSGLVGAIWQVNDKLSFDAAVRFASVDGRPVSELRVGMTFGFPLILSQPPTAQPPFAGARRPS